MKTLVIKRLQIAAGTLLLAGQISRCQEMQMGAQDQHNHMNEKELKAEYPRMGRAQESAKGELLTLERAEKLAGETNPTLRQAEVEIRAAKSRQQQAGLLPNPTLAYTGDEIRGGSVGGGKQGFYVQQTVVTGGKLGLSRDVYGKEVKLAEAEAEEQKIRVQSAVKMAFLRVLGAQELLDARKELAKIARDYSETQQHLKNTGQTDETEVLDAELEAKRMAMTARMQENTLREEWRSLTAVIGQPELPLATAAGDLEKGWPEVNEEEVVEQIAKSSPAVRIADMAEGRAQSLLTRAKREAIPDLQLRGGLEYNNELLGTAPFAKGWEGIAEVAVQIPVFNRNQGNVASAAAESERARYEKTRIGLTLRERAASIVDQYANAKVMAVEYREEVLPLAKKSYGLMVARYGQMLTAYPRVVETQRKMYELQIEYISALETVWTTGIALEGYLLTDGLEAPARPGEVDLPIRETNLPVPDPAKGVRVP